MNGAVHSTGHGTGSDSDNSLGTAEDGRVYDFICIVDDALFKKKINNVMSKNRGMTQVRRVCERKRKSARYGSLSQYRTTITTTTTTTTTNATITAAP
jgi:hypothetical protein